MKDLFDVAGKTVVITGGSSGIGAMMARGFLENGAKVYITARKAERLFEMEESLKTYGDCTAIQGDMSSVSGIEDFVSKLSKAEEHIDILINNAGANWVAPIDKFPETGWDKVMDINVKSIFFMTLTISLVTELTSSSLDLFAPFRSVFNTSPGSLMSFKYFM